MFLVDLVSYKINIYVFIWLLSVGAFQNPGPEKDNTDALGTFP